MVAVSINIPGALPDTTDEPPEFDTAREAWEYLHGEYRQSCEDAGQEPDSAFESYFNLYWNHDIAGTVFTTTPGYDGNYDQGRSYSVQEVE